MGTGHGRLRGGDHRRLLPTGLPNQIFIAFQEFGLSGALPFALLLVVAALPLPILAYLWSARARARVAGMERAMSAGSAPFLDVDLEVERRGSRSRQASASVRDRLAIFGTSGAGKTTILESIAGLTHLRRGYVRVDGKLVAGTSKGEAALQARDRQVALVRQPTTLFPHLTVEQNVAYGIVAARVLGEPYRRAARAPRARAARPGTRARLSPAANDSE